MSWKDRLAAFNGKAVMHTVQGEEIAFYPITVATTFKAKEVVQTIAASMGVLFSDTSRDSTAIQRKFNADGEMPGGEEFVTEGLTPDMAEMRVRHRKDAIDNLLATLTNPANMKGIGEIIMDSMRDEFADDSTQRSPQEFFNTLPLPILADLLIGVFRANKEVFGPLSRRAEEMILRAQTKMNEKMDETLGKTSENSASGSPAS